MSPLIVDGIVLGVMASIAYSAALLTAGGPARRLAGLVFGGLCFAPPFFAPHPLLRAVYSILAFAALVRLSDLVLEPEPRPLARLLHVAIYVDSRDTRRARARLDARGMGWWALCVAIGGLGYQGAAIASGGHGGAAWALRWGGGLVLVYFLVDGAYSLLAALLRGFGLEPPPLHRHPALSRSVDELWGQRWNLTLAKWFRVRVFRPLARRRRAGTGQHAAFVLSGLIHAWLVFVAIGAGWAAIMGLYFCSQGALIVIERRLGVRTWRPGFAHAWVVVAMTATSPLFVEPMLRVIGVAPPSW